jgi:hypothetical protein
MSFDVHGGIGALASASRRFVRVLGRRTVGGRCMLFYGKSLESTDATRPPEP